jgi:hypothetical protein
MDPFKEAIKALHTRKDAAYGAAWKRRGERISALPNIARKVDRLEVFASKGVALEGEAVLDTVIDLFVYVTKYRLLLADQDASVAGRLLSRGARAPYSDEHANFDYLVDVSEFSDPGAMDAGTLIARALDEFERLWPAAEAGAAPKQRMSLATELSTSVEQLLGLLVRKDPQSAAEFTRKELGP